MQTDSISDLFHNVALNKRVFNVLVKNCHFKCIKTVNATAICNSMLNVSTSQTINIIKTLEEKNLF